MTSATFDSFCFCPVLFRRV